MFSFVDGDASHKLSTPDVASILFPHPGPQGGLPIPPDLYVGLVIEGIPNRADYLIGDSFRFGDYGHSGMSWRSVLWLTDSAVRVEKPHCGPSWLDSLGARDGDTLHSRALLVMPVSTTTNGAGIPRNAPQRVAWSGFRCERYAGNVPW